MVTRCRGVVLGAAAIVLLCVACNPRLSKDEDVERALEKGRTYRSRHLYAKAEETFLSVLQRHPKDARVHQELGYLYFEDLADYVSALYHLERYLKAPRRSQPNDLRSDVLEQVRAICQQEIAKEVSLSVLTAAQQKEIRSLGESNKTLRLQVSNLTQRLAKQAPPQRSRGDGGSEHTEAGQSGNAGGSTSRETPPQVVRVPSTRSPEPEPRQTEQPRVTSPSPSTHTIRRGDTLYSLARRYGVSVARLQRANPRAQPDNLQIGQRITIPEP
jgi:LysM repeat protein